MPLSWVISGFVLFFCLMTLIMIFGFSYSKTSLFMKFGISNRITWCW